MEMLITLILSTIAILVTAQIAPGVKIDSFWTAVVVAVVLGVLNTFIRPILLILTLPISLLTLGLFTLVIMGLMVYIVSALVPGFQISSFFSAIIFSVILALINYFLSLKQ